jgi:hydroxymethylglutaryl-CoA reductase
MGVPRETMLSATAKLDESRALDEIITRFVADIQTLMGANMVSARTAERALTEVTEALQDKTKSLVELCESLQEMDDSLE